MSEIFRAKCATLPHSDSVEIHILGNDRISVHAIRAGDAAGARCIAVHFDMPQIRRLRDFLDGMIGDRWQPIDEEIEAKAIRLFLDHLDGECRWSEAPEAVKGEWRDIARRALTAEAQPQPDLEAAVLALAKDLGWEAADDNWRNHYIKRARAKLTPTLPVPKTVEEIDQAFAMVARGPGDSWRLAIAELAHSWLAAKGGAA